MLPPPPLEMTRQDEPPLSAPTDTAGRPQQPRVRVAPEGGESLARPTGTTPPINQPQQPPSRPGAPRQVPQPPQLPPVDLDRLIPTALTAASLARLAQQRQQPAADLSNIPAVDYRGQPYTQAQRRRIAELGRDQIKGFVPEEGEPGLAAEEEHGLRLQRYTDRGLEFVDRHGNYWDVVSPASVGLDGRPAFRLDPVINAIKRHFLKGNVILDYGRLNEADAAALRRAVDALTDADKHGQMLVAVRNGE